MSSSPVTGAYSVRDIIGRYESEEEEFLRELEDMRQSIQQAEQEEDIPQDPAPILSVLCSLVDEIGSLRNENRQLKTRLAPGPSRTKNMVQRMSAIFDNRTNFLPKLRKHTTNSEVRLGARERMCTPPRKDCLTTSSISTDLSVDSRTRGGGPPLVQPELSDSDLDDNIFSDDHSLYDQQRRGRNTQRRCEMSLSECTSPSSASSSRDPSEGMTSSRLSFLEMFGLRGKQTGISHLPPVKPAMKKRKRRVSQNDINENHRTRQLHKPIRPASYYVRDDSEDSDNMRARRETSSFLSVNHAYSSNEAMLRVDREERLRHEKDGLAAEIEELKTRNQRLVEQLREKSSQNSKLQVHINRLEQQTDHLVKRCTFNEALDKLTVDERLTKTSILFLDKIDDNLRKVDSRMQAARIESANQHQKTLNKSAQERAVHQTCLEQLEKVQKENFNLLKERFKECGSMDAVIRRKIDSLPSYEALYSFTSGIVRKLNELRWTVLEKSSEVNKAEMELIATQTSLLITHAQIERLRIGCKAKKRRRRRPASYHGEHYSERLIRNEFNFYLPFKLQGSRIENMRRAQRKNVDDVLDKSIEDEFLSLFGSNSRAQVAQEKHSQTSYALPTSRIELMMREMSGGRQRNIQLSPIYDQTNYSSSRHERRPISLVEIEDGIKWPRFEESRRSIKYVRDMNSDNVTARDLRSVVSSLQDVHTIRSPNSTPVSGRRMFASEKRCSSRLHDSLNDQPVRARKLERGFSSESRYDDRNLVERREDVLRLRDELAKEREDRKREEKRMVDAKPVVRLQRSQPVQGSRIRPPSISTTQMKARTLETNQRVATCDGIKIIERSRTLETNDSKDNNNYAVCNPIEIASGHTKPEKTEKKSWLEKIRQMKR